MIRLKDGMSDEYAKYVEINSGDGYSRGVVTFTERWATAMEAEIEKGLAVADIADSTSHAADTEGITGFMYDCAVQSLTRFWKHGSDLLAWHNRKYITDPAKADAATEARRIVSTSIFEIKE